MLEERIGPLGGRAYLITDYCAGEPLIEAYLGGSEARRRLMDEAFSEFFDVLLRNRISHRDTKAANFLWCEDRLWALDLDSIRYHRSAAGARAGSRRDRAIFLKSWQKTPAIHRHLAELIS